MFRRFSTELSFIAVVLSALAVGFAWGGSNDAMQSAAAGVADAAVHAAAEVAHDIGDLLSGPVREYHCTETLTANVPELMDCGLGSGKVKSWWCEDESNTGVTARRGGPTVTTSAGKIVNLDATATSNMAKGNSVTYVVAASTTPVSCVVGY